MHRNLPFIQSYIAFTTHSRLHQLAAHELKRRERVVEGERDRRGSSSSISCLAEEHHISSAAQWLLLVCFAPFIHTALQLADAAAAAVEVLWITNLKQCTTEQMNCNRLCRLADLITAICRRRRRSQAMAHWPLERERQKIKTNTKTRFDWLAGCLEGASETDDRIAKNVCVCAPFLVSLVSADLAAMTITAAQLFLALDFFFFSFFAFLSKEALFLSCSHADSLSNNLG